MLSNFHRRKFQEVVCPEAGANSIPRLYVGVAMYLYYNSQALQFRKYIAYIFICRLGSLLN
jgi:hypothetical protein